MIDDRHACVSASTSIAAVDAANRFPQPHQVDVEFIVSLAVTPRSSFIVRKALRLGSRFHKRCEMGRKVSLRSRLHDAAQSHPAALWRLPQVLAVYPVSPAALWAAVRTGKFPQPIKLSSRVTVWRSAEVVAWLEKAGSEPISCGSMPEGTERHG